MMLGQAKPEWTCSGVIADADDHAEGLRLVYCQVVAVLTLV